MELVSGLHAALHGYVLQVLAGLGVSAALALVAAAWTYWQECKR